MKRTLLLLTVGAILSSCATGLSEDSLVGTWNVTDFKVDMEDISPDLVNTATEIALSTTYHLNDDGTYKFTDNSDMEDATGSWSLDEEKSELKFSYTIYDMTQSTILKISDYTGDEMKWIEDMDDQGTITYTLLRAN